MKCKECYTINSTNAFFCDNCGKSLRSFLGIDVTPLNIRICIFCVLIILIIICLGTCSHYSGLYSNEKQENHNKENQINNLKLEKDRIINEYEQKKIEYQTANNNLTKEINRQKSEIENLKPQRYYTLYSNQYLYNKCEGKYTQANCYYPSKGSIITIYKQEDGYGLTHLGGWIPMSRLENY